ncbi:CCA tRNA nucleotidyltransferase [Thermaurantiacus sp.]
MTEAAPPRLDPALWRHRPGIDRLFDALDVRQGATRIVGGAVRDALLGAPVSDLDLATRLAPTDVVRRLEEAGLKAVPTGLAHGTVTAIAGGLPYEVTTLRVDKETDGRWAKVAFTGDWEADATRRDFTVNALYADPLSGEVHDYVGGIEDLKHRIVRFIGDPFQRIAEDHLRILRFFRFSARLAAEPDPAGLAACTARRNDLLTLSRERIRDELLKLLSYRNPAAALAVMESAGILKTILPEGGDLARLAGTVAAEERAGVPPDPLRRLAALLPEDPDLAAATAARLRLSRKDQARLKDAATPGAVPADPRILAYRTSAEAALDRLLLTDDPRAGAWAPRLAGWHRPRLPVSGRDLIAMGLAPGPQVSRTLRRVEERWMETGFPAERSRVLQLARDELGLR